MTSGDDSIRDTIARYQNAYRARDQIGCGAVYTPDALVLSPWGPPVRGRDAIVAAHVGWFAEGETNKVLRIVDVTVDGALAVCLLHYTADVPAATGGLTQIAGASLNILQRQQDGAWLIRYSSLTDLEDSDTGFAT